MKLILIILFLILHSTTALADVCLGLEDKKDIVNKNYTMNDRFGGCSKGDIISVYTMSLNEAKPPDLHNVDYYSMRKNELSDYCDFNKPIIKIGETHLEETKIYWFNCVYLGKKREAKILSID